MYLISPHKKQYKANLHCHSTVSDGKCTPEELKAMYKQHDYSVLSITDHERPCPHNDLTDDDFILLTGYECYIRSNPTGAYEVYEPEVHLNLFARDPENATFICYHPVYNKYMSEAEALALPHAGSERPRTYDPAYVNEYIRTAKENGYLVAYNHPYWSLEAEKDILDYEGFFSMEMCNYSSYTLNHLEYNGQLYDRMLRSGKRVFCHATDDNHNKFPEGNPNCDSFGGFTMLMPDRFTYQGLIEAMERGEMYSSMGPVIHEVSIEDNRLHIECSPAQHILAYTGSKTPCRLHMAEGQTATSADFTIDDRARYIRVSVVDPKGLRADTRGYFRDEFGFPPLNK